MKNVIRFTSAVTAFAAVFALAAPLAAQTREGLMGDLLRDISGQLPVASKSPLPILETGNW